MKTIIDLIPLFEKFIRESQSGRRRKRNGEKLTKGSVQNYYYALKLIKEFCGQTNFSWRAADIRKLNKREFNTERNYWKKFYINYTNFLYKQGNYDNYVGANIKQIRTFINYLRKEKNIDLGEFHKDFYIRKEKLEIKVLNPEQLKFLIHDASFQASLSKQQQIIKDVFVFGCTTGLRFSDLELLSNQNFIQQQGEWYVNLSSKKTKTFTKIKLPDYAIEIYLKYKPKRIKQVVFPLPSLMNFNKHLKIIGEKAGWTQALEHKREKLGKAHLVKNKGITKTRFCDFMSSHMMRRTAITTMLILGMPEHLVRNMSGHSKNSASFFQYVHYAQSYLDKEFDKVHEKLSLY